MPVRKFRSVEETEEPWRRPGDPALYRAIAAVWALGRRTVPRWFPPGVHSYRSIEELEEQTERWQQENFERFHSRKDRRSLR